MTKMCNIKAREDLTPIAIRDEIINCFIKPHSRVLNEMKDYVDDMSPDETKRMKKLNVELLIKNIFEKIKADYENPTKHELIDVCNKLRDYAQNFRRRDLIEKHYQEIMILIEKLPVEGNPLS